MVGGQQLRRDLVVSRYRFNGRVARWERWRGGFTLIELLVVVAIIALLVSLLIPALGEAKAQAKASVCAANLHGIGNAYATYVANNDGLGNLCNFSDAIDPNASPLPAGISRFWFGSFTVYPAPTPTKYDTNGFLAGYYTNTRITDCPALSDEVFTTTFPKTFPRVAYGYNLNTNTANGATYKNFKFTYLQAPAETVALQDNCQVSSGGAIPVGTLTVTYVGYNPDRKAPTFHARHPNGQGNVLWQDGHVSGEKPYLCSLASSYNGVYSPYINTFVTNHIGMLTPATPGDNPEPTLVFSATYPNANPINLDYYYWVSKDKGF